MSNAASRGERRRGRYIKAVQIWNRSKKICRSGFNPFNEPHTSNRLTYDMENVNSAPPIWSFCCWFSLIIEHLKLGPLRASPNAVMKLNSENQAWTGFEPITSALPMKWSTNWTTKPSGSLSCCEFVINSWMVKKRVNTWKVMYFNYWEWWGQDVPDTT